MQNGAEKKIEGRPFQIPEKSEQALEMFAAGWQNFAWKWRAEKALPEFFILGDKATKQKTSFLQSSPSVSVSSCFLKLKGFDSAVYLWRN